MKVLTAKCDACLYSGTRRALDLLIKQHRHLQTEPLVKAGYRVIAPDLRGAVGGESDAPQEIEAYDIQKVIVNDIAGTYKHAIRFALHLLSLRECSGHQEGPKI